MSAGDARKYARDVFGGGVGDKAYDMIKDNSEAYGLKIIKTSSSGKMFASK